MNFEDVTQVRINGKNIAQIDFENTTLWTKPPTYTELDYIQATGTQYITTGTPLLSNTSWTIELDIQFTAVNYNYNGIWGLTSGTNKYEAWVARNADSYTRYNGIKPSSITMDTSRHIFRDYYNGSSMMTYIDNTLKRSYNSTLLTVSDNVNLIRSSNYNGQSKLYGAKLYIGNKATLVRDFIPVLDDNNVPCLYDKVNQEYIYNAGTGTFLYGLKGA